ncbi:MAG: YlxR family protein [Thermodesulfobacteriota bacterium]|nr:YlxR family protein [Thermodesulfobacteriota bacterium]
MSKKGHIPIRMCIGCRKRRMKKEMVRFTLTADAMVLPDGKKNRDARGFYLCPDPSCLKMAKRKNRLGQAVEINL